MDELNDSADVFANSSNETIKENFDYLDFVEEARKPYIVPFMNERRFDGSYGPVFTSSPLSPQKSKILPDADNISFIANQFISEACNVPVILYCPFCCFTCHFEFIFKDHIKNTHPREIMSIVKSNTFYFEFHACPFCHAKFYIKDLLPKHVLHKHEDAIAFTGLGQNNYAQCRFCSFKLLQKHIKRLIMHVEKKHMTEFENFLKHQNTNVNLSSKDLKFFCDDIDEKNSSSSLKSTVKPMEGKNKKVHRVKSILKPPKSPKDSSSLNENLGLCMTPNNGSYEAIRIQNSARRKLRFDLPDSLDDDKENLRSHSAKEKKNKIRWFSLFKKDKKQPYQLSSPSFKPVTTPPKSSCEKTKSFFTKFHLHNDGVSLLATNHFKCGLCSQEFDNNAQLLNHLHCQHKGLNLSAQYRCGACNAKFYRNSYLVRHCWYHHAPLCLKQKGQVEDAS